MLQPSIQIVNHKWSEYVTKELSFEFTTPNNDEPEIRNIQVWNCKRDIWESSDSLPEFVEQFLYDKCFKIITEEL